jgi:hypothetical protein
MPRSKPETEIHAVTILSLFMRAMAFGVVCAGLLLFDPQIDLTSILTIHDQWLARLLFLLWIGMSFGVGATIAKMF